MSEDTSPKKPVVRSRSRSKSETRRSTAGTNHPIVDEDEKKIKNLENHFNHKWDLNISLDDIKSLINNIEGHKRDQGYRTKWQTTALLNYLSFLDANLEQKLQIIKTLERLTEDHFISEGYKSIVLALLARFNLEVHKNEKALQYLNQYKDIECEITGNLSDHPEVLASKAFALAFCSTKDTKQVIKLYKEALDEKPEESDWLFGLCLAMEKELRVPGQNDDKDIRDLEKNLRHVIKIDSTHYQAKIILAKRLVMKEAYEEADHFIKSALPDNEDDFELSATKLEMLGALFERGCMSKLYKNHLEKAIEKYSGALSINSSSEKAIHGYSRCILQRFLNARGKGKDNDDLNDSRKRMEKMKNSSFVPHLLTLARIYSEIALLENDESKFHQSEEIYERMIKKFINNKDKVYQLCEGYWHYSVFLQKHGKKKKDEVLLKKEVTCLEDCVQADRNGPHTYACAYAIKAQNQLLEYATLVFRDGKENQMTIVKAYEVKSLIYSTDEDYDSAIFYIGEAIKHGRNSGRSTSQIESLIGMLLDASKNEDKGKLLMQAQDLIGQLEEGDAKKRLNYEVIQIRISTSMDHEKLQALKTSALKFEEIANNSDEMADLSSSSFAVFGESRSALDYSMGYLRDNAYPDADKRIFFPYFTTSREELTKIFEKKKFHGIKLRHPEIIDFIAKKNEPKWVKDFIDTRNLKTHEDPSLEKLIGMTKEDLTALTQNAYFLGADVFNFVAKTVADDVHITDDATASGSGAEP
eukprot:GFUD01034746.1.p1 GENE.GFUD01034746.1~~GFUD01034746.1.p1  ORF type:complete len:755 (+),score=183.93 GFUD01034746.1:75-2339(+)